MKAKTLWIFLAGVVLLSASCRHHSQNRMVMNDGVNRVEVRYEGDIQFNEDETSIARISSGGYLEYWRNDDHLLAGVNDKGVLQVELYENGKPVDTASAEGKALEAKVIKGMIGLGFDMEGRMERLYRRGGYAALLREVDSVDGDYIRGRYLERILESDSLSPAVAAAVMNRLEDKVGSDYDKSRLLEKVDTQYLKNDSVCAGYLAVVKSIHGDYEKSQALQHFLRGMAEGRPFDSLLQVVGRMNGDYEKSNLLKQIIQKDPKEGGSWAGLIRTTTTVDGEYERSNVLVEIGQKLPKVDSLRALYMTAAKTVHSDVDYGRVVKAVEL
jgi:hypothetical protein